MKRTLKKTTQKYLFWGIFLSVCLVAGIPLLIVFLSKGYTWTMAFTVPMVVGGFYGMPIVWIGYASKKNMQHLVEMITVDGVYDVEGLARATGKQSEQVLKDVRWLINQRYLTNFSIAEDRYLVPFRQYRDVDKTLNEMTGNVYTVKCPNCGGAIRMVGNSGTCEYCGFVNHQENSKKDS